MRDIPDDHRQLLAALEMWKDCETKSREAGKRLTDLVQTVLEKAVEDRHALDTVRHAINAASQPAPVGSRDAFVHNDSKSDSAPPTSTIKEMEPAIVELLQGAPGPVRTSAVVRHLEGMGFVIGGKRPDANLSARLGQTGRFVSNGRAGWTLAPDIVEGSNTSTDATRESDSGRYAADSSSEGTMRGAETTDASGEGAKSNDDWTPGEILAELRQPTQLQ